MSRLFGVRELIEMARFDRTEGTPQFSPDGRYFAVVTTRGIVRSDKIESTLRVFQSQDVLQYLRSDRSQMPRGRVIAKVTVTPEADYANSYEPVISGLRWLSKSRAIFFLAQNSRGNRQLCRVSLASASVQKLNPEDHDVSQFDANGDVIVYRRTSRMTHVPGVPINADARDVTGVPLPQILFPQRNPRPGLSDLWTIRGTRIARVVDAKTHHPVSLLDLPPPIPEWSPLSLSPDGQRVVVLLPVRSVPVSWEAYEPALASLKLRSNTSELAQEFAAVLPTQYALINLTSHESVPLVNAPNGYLLGYGSRNLAVWSLDGRALLLTNTYLPLGSSERSSNSNLLRPCAALVMNFVSKKSACVAFDRGEVAPLLDASISDAGNVFLRFANAQTEEHFQYRQGTWEIVPSAHGQEDHEKVHVGSSKSSSTRILSVAIRQDLNTPPTLWAMDLESRRSKQIWDPNPQLARMALGKATIYRWKDKAGYEWCGGLVIPPNYKPGRRYPLVIQTHGFEEDEFMTDGSYTTAFSARPLAAVGIMVLQMADRFDDLESANEASNRILGFESAIDHLASDGLIDRHKVGIIGFSRTCYHVESALIKDPSLFVAATIADGVDESYMQYLLSSVGERSSESEGLYGGKPFGEGLERWIKRAPGFHLDQLQTALRIEAITARSILSEWEIYASLWRQGKPVDLIYLPKGQHILQKPLERMASQQGNVDWFRFWLKGDEDPNPAKTEQYARWRTLMKLSRKKNSPE